MSMQFPHITIQTHITKTYLYDFDPLKPHFYVVKLGFTGVYIIFLISAGKNIDCGYSLEPPRRGGSNEYSQSIVLSINMKSIRFFYLKTFSFLVGKISIYLNRRVLVIYYLGRVQRKHAFEHAQNAQIQVSCVSKKYRLCLCSPVVYSVVSNNSVSAQ